jgi:putative tryptophan/tyrosine transport system substrate-binding protein
MTPSGFLQCKPVVDPPFRLSPFPALMCNIESGKYVAQNLRIAMRRRDFIKAIGGSVAAWPLAARAQQPAMPVIGLLDSTTAAARVDSVAGFRQGLSEAGFVEGRNVAPIEFRFAENQIDRLPALAADLVRRRVAVIFAAGPTIHSVRAATSTIPIVFVTGSDPAETGIVTSLNKPVGNITGVSFNNSPVNPKRLELLHELVLKPAIIAVGGRREHVLAT